ncbi:MAG TPA: hypothetical protein VFC63_14930 [Blastocatellia bacterium]|nr:hypothetical protein [Blastocatellia bacterium]
MNTNSLLFNDGEIESTLTRFANRKFNEQRRDERRLAEQRVTKHRFKARKSCVADARSYRVAGGVPGHAMAHFDWKGLSPVGRTDLLARRWFKKVRDAFVKQWLSAKQTSQ